MLGAFTLFKALQLATLAYVVCVLLMRPGYIFMPYAKLLLKLNKKASWLAKPLGYCELCFAGQLALWVWLEQNAFEYTHNIFTALLRHGLFVASTIFFAYLITLLIEKCK